MEDKIKTALNDNGFSPTQITQLTAGSYNTVFEVHLSNSQRVVVRIFRSKSWPEEGKLDWISDKLTQFQIPTAKILFSTRDSKHFPNGFMVQEFIEGEIVQNLAGKNITYPEYYSRLGELVRKVHQIQLPNYGFIGDGTGNHASLQSFINREIDRFFEANEPIMDKAQVEITPFKDKVLEVIAPFSSLPPVLTHNDLSPNNVMLDNNDELVLIDWDNAVSHLWINDFAVMTYWMRNRHKDLSEREEYIKLFLKNYNPEISVAEIRKVEKTLHLLQSFNLLGYYSFDDVDASAFEKTFAYFNELRTELL